MKFRKDLPEPGSGANNFLKFKDKESISGIFRGEIKEFHTHWDGSRYNEVAAGTPNAQFKFRCNFVTKEGANYVPKLWDFSLTVYRDLSALNDEYDLEETVVKITRNGTGTDTTYSILPLPPKQQPTKEVSAFIKKVELLPLENSKTNGEFKPQNTDTEEIPF